MPRTIARIDPGRIEAMAAMTFAETAYEVASALFGDDIPRDVLKGIVEESLTFPTPLVRVTDNIYSLELFHGPTMAFKDVGARFMARVMSYLLSGSGRKVRVLVATSGDTGSAVANGFLGVDGIEVVVLYPKGKVSDIQEKQFTTLGENITALEVDGTFDDCQRLVKNAFRDKELTDKMNLTSANSINIARFLPQSFYYFRAMAQLRAGGDVVFSVPSGNFGNLASGLVAKRMGLPAKRFIAANNRNDVFYNYLQTGSYEPRTSVQTIANAMDVGDPSNFVRILDLYDGNLERLRADVSGCRYDDVQIEAGIGRVYRDYGYLCDPHGICGFMALEEGLRDGETGVFLETAHPAKFTGTVQRAIGHEIGLPENLCKFASREKMSIRIGPDYTEFKDFLLHNR